MKKIKLIGAIVGVASVIGTAAMIVYKKIKEKQMVANLPQEKTLLLGNVNSDAKNELMKSELAETDQIESTNSEMPHASLDSEKPRMFEDK